MSRRVKRPAGRPHGMTMIELMVALILGLLVVGAAISTFMASSQVARSMRGLSAVNDSGQSLTGYLSLQIRQAGHLDLLEKDGQWSVLQTTDGQGSVSSGDGSNLAQVLSATYPGLFSIHGCNQAYTSSTALLNYACTPGGSNLAASLTVAYQVLATPAGWLNPSLNDALDLNRGFQTDCGGRGTRLADSAKAKPAGDAVVNRYYLDTTTRRLMCVGNGDPTTPVQIASDIEQFQVLYGVSGTTASGGEIMRNYLTADDVTKDSLWPTVTAVQICALASGEPGSTSGQGNIFNVDCNGNAITATDGRLRKAHRAIINLRSATRSATKMQ